MKDKGRPLPGPLRLRDRGGSPLKPLRERDMEDKVQAAPGWPRLRDRGRRPRRAADNKPDMTGELHQRDIDPGLSNKYSN